MFSLIYCSTIYVALPCDAHDKGQWNQKLHFLENGFSLNMFSFIGDCIKYLLPGKGDFKIEKKRYGTQKPDYYIASLEIKQRTSFYKCTPQEFKYGIDVNSKTWWVDKGCEGIFEIRECHDNPGRFPHRIINLI